MSDKQERKDTVKNCLFVLWFVPTFVKVVGILLDLFVGLF